MANSIFQVVNKYTNKIKTVFAVKNDRYGYPSFLIYDEVHNSWNWIKAKYFKPLTEDEGEKRKCIKFMIMKIKNGLPINV